MVRTKFLALSMAAGALLLATTARADFSIVSDSSTIFNPGDTFSFNFAGRTDGIESYHNLKGIRVDYTFHLPTLPGVSTLDMMADLMVPRVDMGNDYKIGFDATLDLADFDPTYFAERFTSSSVGFIFSGAVKSELLDDDIITGELKAGGGFLTNLNSYFNLPPVDGAVAGSISAFMSLTFTGERGVPGGGGNVPEPASMLVWGALGAGVWARRRYLARKHA